MLVCGFQVSRPSGLVSSKSFITERNNMLFALFMFGVVMMGIVALGIIEAGGLDDD